MFCTRCGSQNAPSARFCNTCGSPLEPVAAAPPQPAAAVPPPLAAYPPLPPPAYQPPAKPGFYLPGSSQYVIYAGFWMRFLALIIDGLIFAPAAMIVGMVMAIAIPVAAQGDPTGGLLPAVLVGGYFFIILVALVGQFLYYSLMESSSHQATLGKKILGLKVTDLYGNRISFGRACGRYFGRFLSGMILNIGYLMAAFTEKKQALHDMLAGCLVLRR